MKIIHVWQHGGKLSADTARRNAVARATWEKVYASLPGQIIERRLDDNILTRTAKDVVQNETRDFPFIHDILRYGCFGEPNDTVILMTNADSCLAESLGEKILSLNGQPAHGHRHDFARLEGPIHDDEIAKGDFYPGSDIFVFTAGWWRKHVGEFPDMIQGAECYDKILRSLILKYGGEELKNMVYHELHDNPWKSQRMTLPSNIYCRNLARTWLKKNNLPPR